MRFFLLLCTLLFSATPVFAGKTILLIGDSLSASYGIRTDQSWPALLGKRLAEKRSDYSLANLSVSGETTAGGRTRLSQALKTQQPAIVMIALGANDGLRGLPLPQMRDNLKAMSDAARAAGAQVMLIGMRLPPNYGPYAVEFQNTFSELAQSEKTPLLPFLLEPVASRPEYFQGDNLHPTAEAQPLLLEHIWSSLLPLLK